jgi:hypothetical protein
MQESLNTNLHGSQIRFWHGTERMIRGNLGSHSNITEGSSLRDLTLCRLVDAYQSIWSKNRRLEAKRASPLRPAGIEYSMCIT